MTAEIEQLTLNLRDWIADRFDWAREASIDDAFEPAQGYSSRTILFTLRWNEGGESREKGLVARLQRSVTSPLLCDVFHQYRVMETASKYDGVHVPAPFAMEPDAGPIGAPFFLMERRYGQVPSDFPSYHESGWVAELPLEKRGAMWWNGIAAMERLHGIDWTAFTALAADVRAAPDARFYIDKFIVPWFSWASGGRSLPRIEQAIALMSELAPRPASAGLVWNDARPGNVMFGDRQDVCALFDFEVATLGPPEIDLGWWLYADTIFTEGFGVARLAGIPVGDGAVAGFERIYGRALPDMDYYLALAALKHAVISVRDYGNDKRGGEGASGHVDFALGWMQHYLDRYRAPR